MIRSIDELRPLVGLEREYAAFRVALSRIGTQGVLVMGEPRTQKSAFVREALRTAQCAGAAVRWIGVESQARTVLAQDSGTATPLTTLSDLALALVLDRIARDFTSSDANRVVLGVDDAHLLDARSTEALCHAIRQRLIFLVAALPEQRLSEPFDELVADGLVERLELRVPVRWTAGPTDWLSEHESEVRKVLRLTAVGEPLELSVLMGLAPAAAIAAAADLGLLALDGMTRRKHVGLWHAARRDLLYRTMSTAQLRTIRRQLADGIEATGAARGADRFRIDAWRSPQSGPPSAGLFLESARLATTRLDLGLAARLAELAVASGGGLEAAAILARAVAGAHGGGQAKHTELPTAPEWALGRASFHWSLGDASEARAVLRRAAARVTEAPARERLVELGAMFLLDSCPDRDGSDLPPPDQLWPLSTPPDRESRRGLVRAIVSAARALERAGRHDGAVAAIEFGLRLIADAPPVEPDGIALALQLHGLECDAHLQAGRIAEAERAIDLQGRPEAAARLAGALRVGWAAQIACAHGDLVAGIEGLQASIEMLRQADQAEPVLMFLAELYADLASATALAGSSVRAAAALGEAAERARRLYGPPPQRMTLAEPWVLAVQGRTAAAIACALARAREAERVGAMTAAILGLHSAVRLGYRGRLSARLDRLAGLADGPLAKAYAAHAHAQRAGDRAALKRSAGVFADLGASHLAGEIHARLASFRRS
jgi:hypothetical protein